MSYDEAFYRAQQEGSLKSARQVIPLIIEMVQPRSAVDVGCGVGTWASVLMERGVKDVVGYDGEYVRRDLLKIPAAQFKAVDLTKPLPAGPTFDLALCIEVGEHLPEEAAATLVESLTRLAPVIVFSAAIPWQGGTAHVNEQWADFWARLFMHRNYVAVDALRPRIWQYEDVEPFYRQNLLIFVKSERLSNYPALVQARSATHDQMLSVVHPKIYAGRNQYPMAPVGHLMGWTWRLARSRIKNWFLGRAR